MLFALQNPFDVISKHLNRSGSRIDVTYFAALACAIGGLWLGFMLIERWRTARVIASQTPTALFLELCTIHDLHWRDRQLLQQALSATPRDQCRLFTDPTLLARLAQEQPADGDRYQKLAKRLFG